MRALGLAGAEAREMKRARLLQARPSDFTTACFRSRPRFPFAPLSSPAILPRVRSSLQVLQIPGWNLLPSPAVTGLPGDPPEPAAVGEREKGSAGNSQAQGAVEPVPPPPAEHGGSDRGAGGECAAVQVEAPTALGSPSSCAGDAAPAVSRVRAQGEQRPAAGGRGAAAAGFSEADRLPPPAAAAAAQLHAGGALLPGGGKVVVAGKQAALAAALLPPPLPRQDILASS